MHLLSKEYDLSFLSSKFKNIEFQLFVSDDVTSYISCIACWCEQSSQIIENWQTIQNYISGYYQPSGELTMWNLYLAFFCVESLPSWEKHEIENNKYAVRKLVLDGLKKLPDPTQANIFLNNHLLGADLELKDSSTLSNLNLPLTLSSYIHSVPLDSKVESREKRAQIINDIIEFLSEDENKKS